jgi:hypothetical protein
MKPVVFTYRSKRSNINPELIKAGYWITKEDDLYFMYERKRGKPLGKLVKMTDRTEMFKAAEAIVNSYFKQKGWI